MRAASRLALALMALALPAPAAWAEAPAAGRAPLAVASGEVTGFYYPLGGALCRLVNKDRDRHGLRCLVEPTSGNAANLAALKAGEADIAVVQSRAHRQAFHGEEAFAEAGAFAELRSLASLHGEALVVVAAKSAEVKSLKNLKDKKVNVGRPQSFQRLMAEAALAAAGVEAAGFAAALEMDIAEQAQALCEGRLDVAFFSGLHPMPAVQQVLDGCEAEVVDLAGLGAEQIAKTAPFLARHSVPAQAYAGLDKDLGTVAMKATLVASAAMPDETAYTIVKVILDNFDAFRAMHPLLADVDKAAMAKEALAAPLHDGAAKAYREAGVIKP